MSVSKKKILISINTSWNVFNFRKNLVRSFIDSGYEVHILAPKDSFSHKLVQLGCVFHPLKMENKGNNPIKDLFLLNSYYQNLSKIKPNIALFFTIKPNIYGSLAATKLGIPFINNVTGLGTAFLHKGLINKIAKQLYKLAFRRSSLVFFQNEDDQNLFSETGIISQQVTDILPGSGINLDDFKPVPLPEKTTFYFISRLLYDKGVQELIDACIHLKEKYGNKFEMNIVGKEETSQNLGIPLEKIKDLESRGILKYHGSSNNIQEHICKASVVVLPSYREGTSRVLLESSAMARPLITTDVPGCKGLINNNGWLCDSKSSKSLITVLEKAIITPKEKLENLGKNSRKLAESTYDEKIVINKYSTAIQHLL